MTGFGAGLAASTLMPLANGIIANNGNLATLNYGDIGRDMLTSSVSYLATAGLSKGIPGNKGVNLSGKISKMMKFGSPYVRAKTGEVITNALVTGSVTAAEDLAFEGSINWSKVLNNTLTSTAINLSVSVGIDGLNYSFQKHQVIEEIMPELYPESVQEKIITVDAPSEVKPISPKLPVEKSTTPTIKPHPKPNHQKPSVNTNPYKGQMKKPVISNHAWNKLNNRYKK